MEKESISLKEIHRAAPLWVIDRFEEDWAVLENNGDTISVIINQLPKNAKPGNTLVRINSKWYINEADTAARAARIKEKFAKLKI